MLKMQISDLFEKNARTRGVKPNPQRKSATKMRRQQDTSYRREQKLSQRCGYVSLFSAETCDFTCQQGCLEQIPAGFRFHPVERPLF